MATVMWSIGRIMGGEEYSIPTYDEILHPKPQDNRKSEAIIGGLIAKLKEGGDDACQAER